MMTSNLLEIGRSIHSYAATTKGAVRATARHLTHVADSRFSMLQSMSRRINHMPLLSLFAATACEVSQVPQGETSSVALFVGMGALLAGAAATVVCSITLDAIIERRYLRLAIEKAEDPNNILPFYEAHPDELTSDLEALNRNIH